VGNPERFEWNFGDGSPVVQTRDTSVISHIFYYAGKADTTYRVTLTAFNACGADTVSREIRVLPNSVRANIELDQDSAGCAPHTVRLVSNQMGFNRVDWDFGDGSRAAYGSPAVEHTYRQPGVYYAKLTVRNGCSIDTDSIRIQVAPSPVAGFESQETVCLGESFEFRNTSTGDLTSAWRFGDDTGFAGTTPPPKRYQLPGNYPVSLIVTDRRTGCRDTLTRQVTVVAPPQAAFDLPVQVCQGEPVLFKNLSTGATQYLWNFQEPSATPEAYEPVHVFTRTGSFQVQLIAYNSMGCTDTVVKQLRVLPSPKPNFRVLPDTSCITPLTVRFENLTTDPPPNEGKFFWDFGNGLTYSGSNNIPPQTYVNASDSVQTVLVTLTVTNAFCTQSVQYAVRVCPKPCQARLVMPNAFTPNGDRLNDTFRPVSVALKQFQMQIFTRWGQEVFRSIDPAVGWDGRRSDGKLFNEGMYVYRISYTCEQAQKQSVIGDFLLIHKE
jgi:gliding motility-associated-like protein